MNNLYSKSCKILKKDIEEGTGTWKDSSSSWIDRISIVKMAILPKAICRFNAVPIKFQCHFSQK
jgi:hypothetical protein